MKKLICWFLGHDWTSKAMQGRDPTKAEIESGVVGFHQYARMYCARCGHFPQLNKKLHTD